MKTILDWQINKHLAIKTIKMSQSVYTKELLKEKKLTSHNTSTIFIKGGSAIKINKVNDYKKADFKKYKCLISKLIYLVCKT